MSGQPQRPTRDDNYIIEGVVVWPLQGSGSDSDVVKGVAPWPFYGYRVNNCAIKRKTGQPQRHVGQGVGPWKLKPQ